MSHLVFSVENQDVKQFKRMLKKAKLDRFKITLTISPNGHVDYLGTQCEDDSSRIDKFDMKMKEYLLSMTLPKSDKTIDLGLSMRVSDDTPTIQILERM